MTRYAVFLRGVNVGGVNLKMADVAATLSQAGFTAVKTLLASGNAVLSSTTSAAGVRTKAEAALRESFGYDAWVLVYPAAELRTISADFPFQREVEGHHSYVTFVSDPEVLEELAALEPAAGELVRRGDGVLYWQVDRGDTLDSAISKTMAKKRYKSSTTTRNLRTVEKVLAWVDSAP
ncbi:MAG: DUF1697 domain-containing protein [Mycobacterium sp.]|nr:DUF1697 domain-containing protein [Mycobacterium sp.]